MDFEKTFPLRYWINLGRRGDRRGEMEWRLHRAGVTAERFPAVDGRFVKGMALEKRRTSLERGDDDSLDGYGRRMDHFEEVDAGKMPALPWRGYESAGYYALALTQRMAIRQAKLKGAEAVLLLEDDVVLHPNFRALVEMLEIPEDWGIFYFGCAHDEVPEPAAAGIVRARRALDTHAVAIRASYYDQALAALDAHGKPRPGHPLVSDRFLAALHERIPTYACFPNLAWQADDQSDLEGRAYSNYLAGGTTEWSRQEEVFQRMYGDGGVNEREVKLGLLFLTRGDVNHPEIWREFISEASERVRWFCHAKEPEKLEGGFLEGSLIDELHETEWGKVGLVKATLALMKAALEDEELTHFVLLSENCVPVRPLPEMLVHLERNPKSRFKMTPLEKASERQRSRAAHVPQVPDGCWRFHSQWWLMDRIAAQWVARADYTDEFEALPMSDEAYFGTVLNLLGYPVEDRVVPKVLTWTEWKKDAGSPNSHYHLSREKVAEIVESDAWFARKFPVGSDVGTWGLHRSAALRNESKL